MKRSCLFKDSAVLVLIVVALVVGFALTSVTSIAVSAQNSSSKPVPKLPNGKPDFTGTWDHPRVADLTKDVKGRCAGETAGCSSVGTGQLAFTQLGKAEN